MWMKNGLIVNTILVPSINIYHQIMMRLPITRKETACDYLNKYMINEVDEIYKIFISDLKDLTFSHYMAQRKIMIQRKIERSFIEEDFGDYDYDWLPNCFRHINT